MMLMVMMRMGGTTENMPTARPWIMTVAGPVSVAAAMERTGAYAWEVQYSVVRPMPNPDTSPTTTVRYSFSGVANPSAGIRVPVCAAASARSVSGEAQPGQGRCRALRCSAGAGVVRSIVISP